MERFYDISELEADIFSEKLPSSVPKEAEETLELILEDGQSLTCQIAAVFLYEEQEYMALLPEDEPEHGVLLLRMSEGEAGELTLFPLSEEELSPVADAFQEWYERKSEEREEKNDED